MYGTDIHTPSIAEATDGLSGADIAEVFRRLTFSKAMNEARSGNPQSPITQKEILGEFEDFRAEKGGSL
jgi:hypothetical protein